VEVLQVLSDKLSLDGALWQWLHGLDFGKLGYAMVGLFFVTWVGSVVIWKRRHIEERWGALVDSPVDVPAR
jgi:nickel/cobalt transporter (NiCoT) family protein